MKQCKKIVMKRLFSELLCFCMVLSLFNGIALPVFAADAPSALTESNYIVAENLGSYNLNNGIESSKAILFGKNTKQNSEQKWYIAGKNSDGSLVLFADPSMPLGQVKWSLTKTPDPYPSFDVNNNAGINAKEGYYEFNEAYKALNNPNDSNYNYHFTEAELAVMKDAVVHQYTDWNFFPCYDPEAKEQYDLLIVSGTNAKDAKKVKMYLPFVNGASDDRTKMVVGNTSFTSASSEEAERYSYDYKLTGIEVDPLNYKAVGDGYWMRSGWPMNGDDWGCFAAVTSAGAIQLVNADNLIEGCYYSPAKDLVPLFHLDMNKVAFVSTAKQDSTFDSNGMTVRYKDDGSKITSSFTVNATKVKINNSTSGEYLMVLWNDGTQEHIKSVALSNTTTSVSVADIGVTAINDNCKIWIEKYVSGDNMIYAKDRDPITHSHQWSYGANGAVITATCTCSDTTDGYDDCEYKDKTGADRQVSLTLNATSPTYSGSAAVSFDGVSSWTGAGFDEPDIGDVKYYKSKGDGSIVRAEGATEISSAAIETAEVGHYVAEYTVSDGVESTTNTATAKVAFEIIEHKHDDIIFNKGIKTRDELTALFTSGGSGFLTADINLTEGISIAENKKVKLDLNGGKITGTLTTALVTLSAGSELYIYDCKSTGEITNSGEGCNADVVRSDATGVTVKLYNGSLKQAKSGGGGSYAIRLSGSGSAFYLVGGNVIASDTGNFAICGCDITDISGGRIYGGIDVGKPTTTIRGGVISNNYFSEEVGAESYIYAPDNSHVQISGGIFGEEPTYSETVKFTSKLVEGYGSVKCASIYHTKLWSTVNFFVVGKNVTVSDTKDSEGRYPITGGVFNFNLEDDIYAKYIAIDPKCTVKHNDVDDTYTVLAHIHTWEYSAAGDTLTAKSTCHSDTSCEFYDTGEETMKLILDATNTTYSGSAVTKSDVFSLTGFDAFKAATGVPAVSKSDAISAIKIYATDEDGKKTGSDVSSSALNVGDYIAELDITVETDPSTVTKTISVPFTVGQATASVSPAPAANTLTYSGEDQELVSADGCAVTGGVIKYSLEEEGDYTTDIPKGKNAGDYRVYYKVVSNSDKYKDSEAAYVDVTIEKKTFDGETTVSGNILAGHASSGSLTLPELPENSQMMYGTPQTKETAISEGDLSIAGGKLLFKGSADITVGTTYSVMVPVIAQTGEYGNYENYYLIVNLIGKTCSHASKADAPEVPAKCTEDGTKAYSTCDSCGTVFVNGEIIDSPEDLIIHAPGHDWKVKADDNKLVASCSRKATCEATDKTLTLSIESKVYDGEAHAGTSISEDEKTAWEAIELEVPEIVYVGVGGTSYESTTPPTEIGSYEARISYGTGENKKTARASFMVNSPITVTFDPNGGRFESEMPPVYVVEGGKVAEPTIAVTNGGMIFYGWYKDPEGDEKWDFENDTVTEDITLYAVWGYPAGVETEAAEMSVARVKDFYYTGKKITPDVRVYFGGKLLTRNIDYTVSYKNVVNASTLSVSNNLIIRDDGTVDYSNVDTRQPSIIIKGKGNYSKKSVALNFNILPLTLGEGAAVPDKKVSADITDVYLQNVKKAIRVKPVIKYSGKKLKKNRDYTLVLKAVNASDASGTAIASGTEYSDLRLPKGVTGSFVLTVAGKGNYEGGFNKEITVTTGELKTLQKAKVKIKKIPYSGESLEIEDVVDKGNLTVKVKGKKLTYGEDYTVAFAEGYSTESRLSAGAYPIVITGTGSYSGTKMTNAIVKGIPVKKAAVTFTEEKPVYTGKHIGLNIDSVTVSVKVNGETVDKTLVRGVDYTATVLNDVKAGKAKVRITGIGAFAGSKTVSYRIQKKELTPDMFALGTFTDDTVALGNFEYYGGARVIPTASISYNGVALISPTDYTIKARNNKNAGSEATGTIVGKGNYKGSIKCTFNIGDDTVDAAKTSIAKARVKIENQIYTGNAITLNADSFKKMKLKVKEDGKTVTKDLVLDRDFEIVEGSYRNNVNRTGKVKATVTLRGIGANGFDGYKTVKFRIVKKDLRWWEKIGNLL